MSQVWKCAHCETEARATAHQMRQTYCSRACMAAAYALRLAGSANPNYRAASEKVCEHCRGIFHSYQPTRRFCSRACHQATRPKAAEKPAKQPRLKLVKPAPKARPVRAEKSCRQCGTAFKVSPSSTQIYCSYQCHLDSGGAFRAGLAAREATMKYGPKKDANHNEIFEELRKHGYVLDMSAAGCGLPDGIMCVKGALYLFDVKNPKTGYGRRGLNAVQKKWIEQWKGSPVYLIYTVEEARRFAAGDFEGIKFEGEIWKEVA